MMNNQTPSIEDLNLDAVTRAIAYAKNIRAVIPLGDENRTRLESAIRHLTEIRESLKADRG